MVLKGGRIARPHTNVGTRSVQGVPLVQIYCYMCTYNIIAFKSLSSWSRQSRPRRWSEDRTRSQQLGWWLTQSRCFVDAVRLTLIWSDSSSPAKKLQIGFHSLSCQTMLSDLQNYNCKLISFWYVITFLLVLKRAITIKPRLSSTAQSTLWWEHVCFTLG